MADDEINREDDRTTNRRNERNEPRNGAQLTGEDERLIRDLIFGSTSYSSHIKLLTSLLRRAPPSTSPFPPPPSTTCSAQIGSPVVSPPPNQTTPAGQVVRSSQSAGNQENNTIPPSVVSPPPNQTGQVTISSQSAGNQESNTIPPPYPWATNIKGKIHSLEYLESNQITTITGDVKCGYCEKEYQVSYNLRERFAELEYIFVMEKRIMRERAPGMWKKPEPRRCELCGREKAVKPVIAKRKRQINWLFLLLGQTLGNCTLQQLKNFCKHSKYHRNGDKDSVLYLTYLGLCKMLQPNRVLFDRP